jgi:hypothetical protein
VGVVEDEANVVYIFGKTTFYNKNVAHILINDMIAVI